MGRTQAYLVRSDNLTENSYHRNKLDISFSSNYVGGLNKGSKITYNLCKTIDLVTR